jgi:glutathione synthase
MHLGIAISRASALDATWTTVCLAAAALERGHSVRFIEPSDWEIDEQAHMVARAFCFEPPGPDIEVMVRRLQDREAPRRYIRLDKLDVLLLRHNPFDSALLSLASRAKDLGVDVVNDPAGILRVCHKGWLATLPDVSTPPSLVTRSLGSAHLFLERQRGPIVVKPAQGSGGFHVSLVPAGDHKALDEAFPQAAARSRHVVVQGYVEAPDSGEKRLVWMDGAVLGGYQRVRAEGEFRHNLKQGALPESVVITATDHALVAPLSKHLKQAGVRLAGIDLLGDYILEVNALNPGGAFHADRLHGTDVSGSIIERLEQPHRLPSYGRETWPTQGP